MVTWEDDDGMLRDDEPAIDYTREQALAEARRRWPDAEQDDLIIYRCTAE
jgi:hypothetical protein